LTAASTRGGSGSVTNSTPTWVSRTNANGMARQMQLMTRSWPMSVMPRIDQPVVLRATMSTIENAIEIEIMIMPTKASISLACSKRRNSAAIMAAPARAARCAGAAASRAPGYLAY
jgi:hypothetical protein